MLASETAPRYLRLFFSSQEGLGGAEGFDAWQPKEIYRSRPIVPASCAAITPPNPTNADITGFLSDGIRTVGPGLRELNPNQTPPTSMIHR